MTRAERPSSRAWKAAAVPPGPPPTTRMSRTSLMRGSSLAPDQGRLHAAEEQLGAGLDRDDRVGEDPAAGQEGLVGASQVDDGDPLPLDHRAGVPAREAVVVDRDGAVVPAPQQVLAGGELERPRAAFGENLLGRGD